MADFQLIGDKQKLSKGPRSYDRSKFSGGKYQQVGDAVSFSSTPVPLQHDSKGTRGGSFQTVGDKVSLGKTPMKGWNSYSTPISERSIFQSVTTGRKAKRK